MNNWLLDKWWSDRFLSEIERIIKKLAGQIVSVSIASPEIDRSEATDYIVEITTGGTISCRIRRPGCKFRDFTIRCRRGDSYGFEYAKIKQGFARWYLYAWADPSGQLAEWVFVDLDIVRAKGLLDNHGPEIPNGDGTYFYAYPIRSAAWAPAVVEAEWASQKAVA